jgi:hypothetical protein
MVENAWSADSWRRAYSSGGLLRYGGMSQRLRIGVLASAAVAALAVAGVRIGHAARSASEPHFETPVYDAGPAEESATLATVHAPIRNQTGSASVALKSPR